MSEKRQIVGHARHRVQGPHRASPAGFTPLRMCVEGHDIELEVTCPVAVVGRHSDVDLRLGFPDVSRRHCQFLFEDGVWRIRDLGSLNGIHVNNHRTEEAVLYAGDHVRIGSIVLLVLTATAVRDEMHEKLRRIAELLPE